MVDDHHRPDRCRCPFLARYRVRQRGSYSGRGRTSWALSGGSPVSTSIRCRSHGCARALVAEPGNLEGVHTQRITVRQGRTVHVRNITDPLRLAKTTEM